VKIVTILGARPQFIKAWAVSGALRRAGASEVVVHTGQHYDPLLSDRIFDDLGLPKPAHHLGAGSGSHGAQTGKMLEAAEQVLVQERPDCVIVYGDTNSTLAGALAAAKLHLPIAHVEAGLRSFNRRMPEEINRVLTDHLSDWLFCPSAAAVENLAREGITRGVQVVGDVMQDALTHFVVRARQQSTVLQQLGLTSRGYHIATIHRADLTDEPARLQEVLTTLDRLDRPVVLPLHPRTRARLGTVTDAFAPSGNLRVIEPLGYIDMLALLDGCERVLTDSGGLQKEAYWLGRPCITLRAETEWTETVQVGWNAIAGTDRKKIEAALAQPVPTSHPNLYGDGHAADHIAAALMSKASQARP
jgi:UDP-GlcNAc3NAcA epimerase